MILVVDDDAQVRRALERILEAHDHECRTAPSVDDARHELENPEIELVLCDVTMPGESGFDLLRHVRATREDLPVVMVSGISDLSFANLALELGAFGYVTKPFEPNQVLIEIVGALRRAELEIEIEIENASYRMHLAELVDDRTSERREAVARLAAADGSLRAASEEMVRALSQAIEGRDVETGQHIMRMSRYTTLLAERLGLRAEACEQIRLASPMHDVGKVAIADVFDALVSRRVYKPAMPLDQAVDVLRAGRGTQFDAEILDVFLDHLDEADRIRRDYPDS